MIKRHTYSSIKAIKLGDINRDTKQNFRETEYKKAERQICFNCPYADCEKGYCDRIKKFRKEWVETHNNVDMQIKNKNLMQKGKEEQNA